MSQTPAEEITAKIRQRRWQMLVHSRLYYIDDDPIVSDSQWQQWANELRDLQQENPELTKIGLYDDKFADWTGDTGYHLPLLAPDVAMKALWVKRIHDERQNVSGRRGHVSAK
mgnify:CR=1 FL=1